MATTIQFTHMRGELSYGVSTRELAREGRDGHRVKLLGQKGQRTQVQITALLVDDAAWNTYDAALIAARGQEVTLQNTTESWTRTAILHAVSADYQVPKIVVVAGSAAANTRLWTGRLEVTPTSS